MPINLSGDTGITTPGLDSAGMPLSGGDPVVESGSNSDGEWTRFSDGTQIVMAADISGVNIASGQEGTRGPMLYPVPFISPPVPQSTLSGIQDRGDIVTQAGSGWRNFDADNLATQTPPLVIRNNSGVTADYRPVISATGRWK